MSNHFPYNLLQNTQVQINGGETTYSASGRAGLAVWGRDRGSFFAPAPALAGLNRALLPTITFGANLTPTATAPGNIVPWLGTTTKALVEEEREYFVLHAIRKPITTRARIATIQVSLVHILRFISIGTCL